MPDKKRPLVQTTPEAQTNILVTGGAGFIGSNFIRYVLEKTDFRGTVINYDKLTYAGNLLSLDDMDKKFGGRRYFFERGDICDYERVKGVFNQYRINIVVHFAAESHVDRSIYGPEDFIQTNINGTFSLLEAARRLWGDKSDVRFHHISTDEVYGSLGDEDSFSETTPYDPHSPYSASKAGSDHLARSYFHTYKLPVTISNCSNNYGPYQFPEKLIPLMVLNAVEGKKLPVYGDGKHVRDWLYVEDHCEALWLIVKKGRPRETYNVGGECEKQNIDVVNTICEILEEMYPVKDNPRLRLNATSASPSAVSSGPNCSAELLPRIARYRDLITFVPDRPGHDRRYAINCDKVKKDLGWKQKHNFNDGLRQTITWYLENSAWVDSVRTGEYLQWMEKNYGSRGQRA